MERPNVSQPELSAAIERIRRRFLDDMCDRILAIETLRHTIAVGDGGLEEIRALIMHVHKIAGIAASVGFPEIGDSASDIEVRLAAVSETHGAPAAFSRYLGAELEILLDELEALID